MATVCVTIPDEQATRIAVAVAMNEGIDPREKTPDELVDLVKSVVFRFLRNETLAAESRAAAQAVLTNEDDPLVNAVMTQG